MKIYLTFRTSNVQYGQKDCKVQVSTVSIWLRIRSNVSLDDVAISGSTSRNGGIRSCYGCWPSSWPSRILPRKRKTTGTMKLDCRKTEEECVYEPECLRCYLVRFWDAINLAIGRKTVEKEVPSEISP